MRIWITKPCWAVGVSVLLCGCMDMLEEQTKKSPDSIIGKKTQEIGEFDPKAKQEISDSKVRVKSPYFYALEAYGPAVEQISKSQIEHAVRLFHAMNERYPKDHDEFMTEIIKKNNIKLPVLPGAAKYKYDVENHALVIVRAIPEEDEGGPEGADAEASE